MHIQYKQNATFSDPKVVAGTLFTACYLTHWCPYFTQKTIRVFNISLFLLVFASRVEKGVKKQLHGGLALAEKREKERKPHNGCQRNSDRVVEALLTRCTIAERQRSSSRMAEWLPVPVRNKVLEQAATYFLLNFAVFPGIHCNLFIQYLTKSEAFTSIMVWI